jgi:hypothetical protein
LPQTSVLAIKRRIGVHGESHDTTDAGVDSLHAYDWGAVD